jgi:thiol-disulfide isomerase/thioredoxin
MRTALALLVASLVAIPAVLAAEAARTPFPALTLTSIDGQKQQVSDFRGTVAVLNFWATWCGPCRMELPELQKIYNDLAGKGFMVAAVNVEGPDAPVRLFFAQRNISLPAFFVDEEAQRELGISSIPLTVLLDRQGRVVRVYAGFSRAEMDDLRQEATKLLAEGKGRRNGAGS